MMQVRVDNQGGRIRLILTGALDETAKKVLLPLVIQPWKQVTINFRGVNFTNSSGIRDWVLFLRKFEINREVFFEDCPPDLIMSFNLITGTLGSAKVKSLLRDYVCSSCHRTQRMALIDGQDYRKGSLPPDRVYACNSCGGEMVAEEITEDFFRFLIAS